MFSKQRKDIQADGIVKDSCKNNDGISLYHAFLMIFLILEHRHILQLLLLGDRVK